MIPRSFYKFLLYRIADMFIILLETTKTLIMKEVPNESS